MTWVNQQLELAEKMASAEMKIKSYQNKGVVYHILGQLDHAEEWYIKSYEMISEITSGQMKDRVLYSLGNLYQHYIADFEKSEKFYQEGYQLALDLENREKQSFYLDHLGMSLFSQKSYQEAIDFHDRAWEILKSQERNINVLFHKVQLSQALDKLGSYDRMGEELFSVIDLKLQNQDPYSNCWFLLLLSEYADQKPSNYEELSPKFSDKLSLSMDPVEILSVAKDLAYKTKHVPSMVNSNLYLAKYKMEDDPAIAMSYLSEGKQMAIQNNRKREIENIKAYTSSIGLDFDTL